MKILSVDDAFETITGYSKDDIRKKQFFQVDLIPEEERTEYLCKVNAELAKCPVVYLEHKIRRKDGTDNFVFCYGRVYYDSAARSQRFEITIADIRQTYSMKQLAGCGAEPGQDPSALLGEDLSKGFLDRASEPCGFPQ